MKKLIALLILGANSSVWASGAAPQSWAYTQNEVGVSSNNDVKNPTKTGKACAYSFLSLIALGNGTVANAKEDGHITQVAAVNNSAFNVLGLYGRYCTIVTGN